MVSDLGNDDLHLVLVLYLLGNLLVSGALPAAKSGADPTEATLPDKDKKQN